MTNINTDMEVLNGAKGEMVQIWVDTQEEGNTESSVQELKYPPSCILIKMEHFQQGQSEGMEALTYLVFLVVKSIEIMMGKGQKHEVEHWQVTLDGTYAFMDYSAQGQTMEYLW